MAKRGIVSHSGPPVRRGPHSDGPEKRDGQDDGGHFESILSLRAGMIANGGMAPPRIQATSGSSEKRSQTKRFNWSIDYSGLTIDQIADYFKDMIVILEQGFTQRRAFQCAGRTAEAFDFVMCKFRWGSVPTLGKLQSSFEELLLALVRNGANGWCIEHARLYVRHLYVLKTRGYDRFEKYRDRLILIDQKKSRKKK